MSCQARKISGGASGAPRGDLPPADGQEKERFLDAVNKALSARNRTAADLREKGGAVISLFESHRAQAAAAKMQMLRDTLLIDLHNATKPCASAPRRDASLEDQY